MADWLIEKGVTVVAMEATGVYWIPVFELLEARGLQVHLVNSRATRQTSGRKSDVLDCQWIWQLMSYGLLRAAFRPDGQVCQLRAYVRQRSRKIADRARCVAHMQKALTQMNIQLDQVISDLVGKTGMSILRAIVAGERNPQVLAAFRDKRIRVDEATIAKSLRGNWRQEHLFALAQALQTYDFLSEQIRACDHCILQSVDSLPKQANDVDVPLKKPARSSGRSIDETRAMHQALFQTLGVDLTAIPSIGVDTCLVLASEIGSDLSRFPTAAHFCSWLDLAPPTRITGGKIIKGRQYKVNNRAAQALRQAACNARNDQSFIGASHRARLGRMDAACAVKATAHQLARLIYAMITKGQA
ncbi:Transposase [compost metagenome]